MTNSTETASQSRLQQAFDFAVIFCATVICGAAAGVASQSLFVMMMAGLIADGLATCLLKTHAGRYGVILLVLSGLAWGYIALTEHPVRHEQVRTFNI
jgi:hypothetical protein